MHRKQFPLVCLILLTVALGVSAQQSGEVSASPPAGSAPAGAPGRPQDLPGAMQQPAQPAVSLPAYFYKHLTGTIGGSRRIVMNLTRIGGRLYGDYYYADQGFPLFFGYDSTITGDGKIHLVVTNELEPAHQGGVTGTFDGRFVGRNELSGIWKGSDSSSPLPFALSTVGVTGGDFDVAHFERAYYDHSRGSATIDVTYPVMRSDSTETDAAFNENIASSVVGMYENGVDTVAPTTVPQAMESFIRSFHSQLAQSNPYGYYPPWTYSITAQLLFNAAGILSVRYESFSFEGGAHPTTVYMNASYLRSTGSVLTLGDLLKPHSLGKLTEVGLEEFRSEHGIAPGESLSAAGYFVTDQSFQLNDNFLVTQAGLLFQYNQYDIAPYYYGAPQLLIPYAKIRSLILPGGPLAALVGNSSGAGSGS